MGSLFQVYNSFHLGAYQVAINEASDLLDLSPSESVEKDCYVYRSYIALGSHQVRLFSRFFQTRSMFVLFVCLFSLSLSRCIVSLSLCAFRGGFPGGRSFAWTCLNDREGNWKNETSRVARAFFCFSLSLPLCVDTNRFSRISSLSLSLPSKNSWSWTKSRTIPRPLYKR